MNDMIRRVEEARQLWCAGDLAGYLTLYDDAVRVHGFSRTPMDKAGVTDFYRHVCESLGAEGKPCPELRFHEVMTDGDLYCCRYSMRGIHRGPFLEVPATGKPYETGGMHIMRFAGPKVVERWSSIDMLGFLVQIGKLPPSVHYPT